MDRGIRLAGVFSLVHCTVPTSQTLNIWPLGFFVYPNLGSDVPYRYALRDIEWARPEHVAAGGLHPSGCGEVRNGPGSVSDGDKGRNQGPFFAWIDCMIRALRLDDF